MPISSIDSTMPSAARSMPHSSAMPGDAKLIDSTSKPSRALSATVMATTITCSRLIEELERTSRGSVFIRVADILLAVAAPRAQFRRPRTGGLTGGPDMAVRQWQRPGISSTLGASFP